MFTFRYFNVACSSTLFENDKLYNRSNQRAISPLLVRKRSDSMVTFDNNEVEDEGEFLYKFGDQREHPIFGCVEAEDDDKIREWFELAESDDLQSGNPVSVRDLANIRNRLNQPLLNFVNQGTAKSLSITQMLLASGANVNLMDDEEHNSLHAAVESYISRKSSLSSTIAILDLLLSAGGDCNLTAENPIEALCTAATVSGINTAIPSGVQFTSFEKALEEYLNQGSKSTSSIKTSAGSSSKSNTTIN